MENLFKKCLTYTAVYDIIITPIGGTPKAVQGITPERRVEEIHLKRGWCRWESGYCNT